MELIPILSLIILVATISTFILAVGAYILYKIRERKGKVTAPQPAAIPAELVAPIPVQGEARAGRRTLTGDVIPTREVFTEYQGQPMYTAQQESGPQMRPTYVTSPETTNASRYRRTYDKTTRTTTDGVPKFTRYTQDGTVQRKSEEKKQEESLRWR